MQSAHLRALQGYPVLNMMWMARHARRFSRESINRRNRSCIGPWRASVALQSPSSRIVVATLDKATAVQSLITRFAPLADAIPSLAINVEQRGWLSHAAVRASSLGLTGNSISRCRLCHRVGPPDNQKNSEPASSHVTRALAPQHSDTGVGPRFYAPLAESGVEADAAEQTVGQSNSGLEPEARSGRLARTCEVRQFAERVPHNGSQAR